MRIALFLPVLAVLSGCGLLTPTHERCEEAPAYAAAREIPPLRVPEGVDLPGTRNALRIPEVSVPEKPQNGRCIDVPPSYSGGAEAGGR